MCNIILTYQFGQLLRVRIPRVGTTWRKKFVNVYPFIYFIIYFWLWWVFIATHCFLQLWWAGISLQWLPSLQSAGSRFVGSVVAAHRLQSKGSVVVAHRLSYCAMAGGILPDQGLNWCPLRCKAILNHWTTREAPLKKFLYNSGRTLR